MAELPTTLTKQGIYELQEAAQKFYPQEIGKIKGGVPISRYSRWPNKKAFDDEIFALTSLKDITKAYDQLQEWLKIAPATIEQAKTVPGKEVLDIEAFERKEAERKKLIADSNKKVQDAIDRKVQLHNEAAKLKTSYVKAEYQKPETNSDVESFKEAAKNSKNLYPELKQSIKDTIKKSIPNVSDADAEVLASKTAYTLIDSANQPEKYVKIAQQQAILEHVSTDAKIPVDIRAAAADEAAFLKLQTQASRIIATSVNPNLAPLFPKSENFSISFSPEHLEGFDQQINYTGLMDGYQGLLQNQMDFFRTLIDLPLDRVQSEITGRAGRIIESQIAKNFPELIGTFDKQGADILLSSLGFGKVAITLPASMTEAVTQTPELLQLMNFGGNFLGVSFKAAVPAAAQVAPVAAPEVAGVLAGGTSIAAGGEAVVGTAVAAGVTAAPLTFGASLAITAAAFVQQKIITGLTNAVSKFTRENGKYVVAGFGAIIAGGIALASGVSVVLGSVVGFGAGFGIATFASGGTAAMSASLGAFGSGIIGVIDAIWVTFLAGIAGPILGILIGFPLVVALILFIINSGAYVVPPGSLQTSSTNPYISVEKVANPNKAPSPTSVTYTVTISAKKDALTGIVIKSQCKAYKKGSSLNCPPEQIPSPPAIINTGAPFTFTFTSNYGPEFQDSLVSDQVTVSANTVANGRVTEVGSASVCFGNCPLDCFAFPDQYWPTSNSDVAKLKELLTGAAATIAGQYPDFAKKACSKGIINLCYKPEIIRAGIYGWHEHSSTCDIDFNTKVVSGGSAGTLYLLTHEATHHIQDISPSFQNMFEEKVPRSEWNLCTYGGNDPSESMAEGDGMFVANPVIYANQCVSVSTYARVYPYHYKFAKYCMFGPDGNPDCANL